VPTSAARRCGIFAIVISFEDLAIRLAACGGDRSGHPKTRMAASLALCREASGIRGACRGSIADAPDALGWRTPRSGSANQNAKNWRALRQGTEVTVSNRLLPPRSRSIRPYMDLGAWDLAAPALFHRDPIKDHRPSCITSSSRSTPIWPPAYVRPRWGSCRPQMQVICCARIAATAISYAMPVLAPRPSGCWSLTA